MISSNYYSSFEQAKKILYTPLQLSINELHVEKESKEYEACNFELNNLKIRFRKAKITPTKTGQFVTCWKRTPQGTIAPFTTNDEIDLLIINVCKDELIGQFIFPKSILIEKGIISTLQKEGKRAFRVYPPWDNPTSKQALKSQQWQMNYFLSLAPMTDLENAINLYF